MRILIAPDAFKESLTASEAAEAMALGALSAFPDDQRPQIDECPVSDGGDGFVDAIARARFATTETSRVAGPLGSPVNARWAIVDDRPEAMGADALATALGWGARVAGLAMLPIPNVPDDLDDRRTAVIESAQCCGLALIPERERNPEFTTSFGLGELIKRALDKGCARILIGLGGSATVDGGIGCAQALGVRFRTRDGHLMQGVGNALNGGALMQIDSIDFKHLDARIRNVAILAACDVNNPLLGDSGAARVFAPQKGATPEQVERLEQGLANLARVCQRAGATSDPEALCAGAAGGIGFGLSALLGATLAPGADLVLETALFAERLEDADLVLTGEGRLDRQTAMGKAAGRVAQLARERRIPVIAVVGSADRDADATLFTHVEVASPNGRPETPADAHSALEAAATRALRRFARRL